jgi:hypothetical protein
MQVSALGTVDHDALHAFFEALADALDALRSVAQTPTLSGVSADQA